MPQLPTGIDLPQLPEKPNPYGIIAQFMSDSLAQAAGVDVVMASDPKHENIEIADWTDWTRLISGFKELSDWHMKAWAWAWTIRFGFYVPPFVAIAPRGGGKSSSAEQIICALGARDTRKYVLYVRATQAQANSSIANIANILENSKISEYYPLMGNRMISAFGQSKGWNRTMLRTASGFTVAAFGLDSALRGSKVDDYRPDFICHEVGTNIYDPDLGYWCKVEQHPGLIKLKSGPGLRIGSSVFPIPEVVTPEHRYWTRMTPNLRLIPPNYDPIPQWREAKDLNHHHFIGYPISTEEIEPQPIATRSMGDGTPDILAYLNPHDEFKVPPEFNDPEWWWLFGVWWRRGGFSGDLIYVSFRGKDNPKTPNRIVDLLQRYGISAERRFDVRTGGKNKDGVVSKQRDNYQIAFRHPTLFRWLRLWTQVDDTFRKPPLWVETLRRDFQKELVRGYIDPDTYAMDGKNIYARHKDIEALGVLKRLMARIGLPAYIIVSTSRNRDWTPGHTKPMPEYSLQVYSGLLEVFGIDNGAGTSKSKSVCIEDGFLWSRVKKVEPVGWATFAPITTKSHTYLTEFGRSHNCHEVGTQIYDKDAGGWMVVENHPGILGIREEYGLTVNIWGLPDAEVVTNEHRYWARYEERKQKWSPEKKKLVGDPQGNSIAAGWVEAKNLRPNHYLGMPIDTSIGALDSVPVFHREIYKFVNEVPPEFNDLEWWWFFGLWWGDGFCSKASIGIMLANTEPETRSRVINLLDRCNIKWFEYPRTGCSQLTFSLAHIHRWLKTWYMDGPSSKVPPLWVEKLDLEKQKQLALGYIESDGCEDYRKGCESVRITSVCLDGLYSFRRILARLGIPSSIRKGAGPRTETFYYEDGSSITSRTKTKYDIRFREGVRKVLGINIDDQTRYATTRMFIKDGYLWSKIRSVTPTDDIREFVPILTTSHEYITNFAKNHNCLDDLDEKHDSPAVTAKKIETLTKSILPAGSTDMTVLAIQNKILDDGIFARLADGTADFLADREMVGPVPAVENLEYRVINNVPQITGGTASWSGQSIDVCEQQMRTWGVRAFLAEAQHITSMPEGGTFDGVIYTRIADSDLPELKEIVCWIDPAVSSTTRSDCQAIQIDGIEKIDNPRKRPRIFRLYSWEGVDSPSGAIKRALRMACDRGAKRIGIETNQGGDLWEDEYLTIAGDMLDAEEIDYIPEFDSAKAGAHTGSKEDRAGRMLTDYTRGYIVHVEGTHTVLEEALGRFPMIAPDDLVDACYWSWYDLRSKDKYRGKPRYVRVGRNQLFKGGGGNTRASHLRRLGLR